MIDKARLREEMLRQRMSQAALAQSAGVSPASIQQILNGKVRHPRAIRAIAEALGVSQDWLEGVDDNPRRRVVMDDRPGDLNTIQMPYLLDELDWISEDPDARVAERTLLFSKSWIRSIAPENGDRELIMIRHSDHEMAPTLLPGDNILIGGEENYDEDHGSIWCLIYGNRSIVRRLRRTAGGRLELIADNPATPNLEVEESEIRMLGKVLWQGRRLAHR